MDIKSLLEAYKQELIEKKLEKDSDDPCWDGYVQLGTKKKGGKEVPNCVPKESVDDDFMRDQGGSGSAAARGTVKKIKGENRWWAKNRAGTMKIFDSEKKANRFAMTNESTELDEQRYSLNTLKSLYGHNSRWSSKKAAENQSKRFADDLKHYGIDKDPKINISKEGSDWKWTYVKESTELDESNSKALQKAMKIINSRITKKGAPPKYPSYDSAPEDIKAAARNLAKNLKESIEIKEDVHNNLNDAIIDFQRKLMRMTSKLDPKIAKQIKEVDAMLDDIRSGDLHNIRPGR